MVQMVDIHRNVVTMDEMTMAQYKIIHLYDTMVTANFQQKFNTGGHKYMTKLYLSERRVKIQ